MSKMKCTGGSHVRTVNKDGTWPETCQCGKITYSELPALGVKVAETISTKEKLR